MAVYKVPQDVEADDKLIGPFSFRQFIYLVIVALAIMMAWGLAQLFVPLLILPLPIVVFFGALALPLRKDQPMEIYMAAMVSFFLKPHRRLWDPDGIDSLIEITVPKVIEYSRTKDLSMTEAERRFSYLAEIVDSQGWAIRGPGVQAPNSAMTSDAYFEAQSVEDILDIDASTSLSLSDKLKRSEVRLHQEAVDIMHKKVVVPEIKPIAMPQVQKPAPAQAMPSPASYFGGAPLVEPATAPEPTVATPLNYNPYPDIKQAVIEPIGQSKPVAKPKTTTSAKVVPAGIINLASNTDLTIAAIAREADRIQKKQDAQEVVIKLR
ncbi:MAG: PrgI family protein [Candidatus Saccharibacteria bacterium]|nr:PrgI family protein [Candidatus Saccharibacteria bacterium]